MTEREKLIELLTTEIECDMDGHGDCSMCKYKYSDKDCERHICNKLADYLLSNGAIVPPVTIGQTIWHLRGWCDGSFEIAEGKVSMLQQKADKSWKVRITVNSSVWDFTPNEIGTKYFLTKEEALKALKEKQG